MTDQSETFDERTIDPDPVKQFRRWFDDAIASGMKLPEAMTLATATPEGKPSARVVLLKGVDDNGFVFYTNYRSAKARQLDANPQAALVFYWPQFDWQVRIEGTVQRTTAEESRTYFATRPRESQIGAWASPQSDVISGRDILETRVSELEQLYYDREVDWPEHWGGYRLKPERMEFWKSRLGRLHDRIVYQKQGEAWMISRLAP